MRRALEHRFDPGRVGPRLIPNRRKNGNALGKHGFDRIGRTHLDRVIETVEAATGLVRALAQFPDMLAAPLDAFLSTIQKRGRCYEIRADYSSTARIRSRFMPVFSWKP